VSLDKHRREYTAEELRRSHLDGDPLVQFQRWLDNALALELKDATAMALATASADAVPSVRIVLLKGCDHTGFSFFTDYRSQKGRQLDENPAASLLFHWRELERQVRVSGLVQRLPAAMSEEYFASRPAASRLAAAASQQSAVIADRQSLESAVNVLARQYPDGAVPAPPQWGGYLLQPETYEFWQGREGRLHDRFRYRRSSGGWQIERLQP
jgi:pyridoxamine 5'-phosphate oxidase